ncbi:MAG: hypothetical protein L0Y44_02755 [Phycisphaerales bacterium]|nr:hypothetical protein [Phycisphaerales bacterium]
MICQADTIGVFQIESRAQMSMLPRLRPRCFYDLVIEVAIVRPGPIQGDMVHPYLRRRNGEEKVTYPNDQVKKVLGKTLGVPLFQEQAMSLAMVAAGFTAGEADQLRRAIAAWKTKGNQIAKFGERLCDGMIANGYDKEFAERCFNQIKGFSGYGFPESHAASFAHLVYVSAWLKKHYPAAFAAALLNSQPMGFYLPAQIVRDAAEHGVEVRPVDVNHSAWDCTLEEHSDEATKRRSDEEVEQNDEAIDIPSRSGNLGSSSTDEICASLFHSLPSSLRRSVAPSLRLGLRLVKGLSQPDADAIRAVVLRHGPFQTIDQLRRAANVRISALRRLAYADAFNSMGMDRQNALWQVRALRDEPLPIFDAVDHEPDKGAMLPPPSKVLGNSGDSSESKHAWPNPEEPASNPSSLRRSVASSLSSPLPPVPPLRKVAHDYASTGLSLKAHPISFIREKLRSLGATPAGELKDQSRWPHGKSIAVGGLVLVRQRPSTANGIVFMTIEDETGIANLIVRPNVYQNCRKAARHAIVILARGRVERQGEVVHILVHTIDDVSTQTPDLHSASRDFH